MYHIHIMYMYVCTVAYSSRCFLWESVLERLLPKFLTTSPFVAFTCAVLCDSSDVEPIALES
jgi:hypothetical protein